jgi:oxaloacetate decarboxylase alpha subunit
MLPKAVDGIDAKYIEQEEDILSYVILPEPALQFFQWRALSPGERPETPADIEIKKMKAETDKTSVVTSTSAQGQIEQPVVTAPAQISLLNIPEVANELLQKIDGLTLEELIFRKGGFTISVRPNGVVSSSATAASAPAFVEPVKTTVVSSVKTEAKTAVPARPAEAPKVEYSSTINAPFVGTLYLSPGPGKPHLIKVGDIVEKGGKVCIVEAMKLFNEITAPKRCKIVKILVTEGVAVEKGQPLVGIEEL